MALSAIFKTPYFIERNKTQSITLSIYEDGSLVTPSSGTVSVYDADGTAIVDGQTVTISSSISTYQITSTTLPTTLSLSENWKVEWTLVISGETHIFRNEAQLVLRSIYAVIQDGDLTERHSDLLNTTDKTTLQSYIDSAWDKIQVDLLSLGKRPNLIVSSYSLKEPHTNLALSFVFRDMSTYSQGTAGKYTSLADKYFSMFKKDMEDLRLTYDYDEDNIIDSEDKGVAGRPVIYLNGIKRRIW